ncbi:hypothetical protein ACIRPZ_17050 [Streptomyces anulatus]
MDVEQELQGIFRWLLQGILEGRQLAPTSDETTLASPPDQLLP